MTTKKQLPLRYWIGFVTDLSEGSKTNPGPIGSEKGEVLMNKVKASEVLPGEHFCWGGFIVFQRLDGSVIEKKGVRRIHVRRLCPFSKKMTACFPADWEVKPCQEQLESARSRS